LIAGVDEAGRGPLAGPVIAAAVILDPARPIEGIADSKTLSPRRREVLAEQIRERAIAWAIGRAEPGEIDTINILEATLSAMCRAVLELVPAPTRVLVDGNRAPSVPYPVETVIGGDRTVMEIAAASILAKTTRDAEMRALDIIYPGWGFAVHKGYPTPAHLTALAEHGPSPVHRRSFAPVRRCLEVD
jgi:ribonuclease HII